MGLFSKSSIKSPEHVIIKRPSGAEDFVPISEFLGTVFEVISNGYCRTHIIGLSYKHLSDAVGDIPNKLSAIVRKHVIARIGEAGLKSVDTRLVDLGASSLNYMVMVTVGPACGKHWGALKSDISNAAVEASLTYNWDIPFPQLVLHKAETQST